MKKVLVVDDSKTIRTLCEWIFKGLEDRLITAENAGAARELVEKESPDVIVVDYTLPDADSYEFVASLKDRARVVMMGGTYAAFDPDKAKAMGAAAVITKPFKTEDFFNALEGGSEGASQKPVEEAAATESVEKEEAQVSEAKPAEEPAQPSGLTPSLDNSVRAAAPRRFNFPGVGSGIVEPVAAPEPVKPAPVAEPVVAASPKEPEPAVVPSIMSHASSVLPKLDSGIQPIVTQPAKTISSVQPAIQKPQPIQSVVQPIQSVVQPQPAAVSQQPAAVESSDGQMAVLRVEIDPAILKAAIAETVRDMLPELVQSYLTALVQSEIKPQLQNWVGEQLEAVLRKFLQQ